MAAFADRITAASFVRPPELGAWELAPAPAGRIGGVRLELAAGPSGTRFGACYQQVPLRVLPPFHFAPDQPALVYLLNPTAGLLDGDAHLLEITARAGTRAVVTGQSATRIHPCVRGYSTQQWWLRVEAGAVLVVLPGPVIPFRGSRHYQRVRIELAPGAGLVWGDLWVAGRYARRREAERFQFDRLIQDLEVSRHGSLAFRDRFCWRGPWDGEAASWHFGDAPACGSLFVTGRPGPEVLVDSPEVPEGSLFPTAAGDTCWRWCGDVEPVLSALVPTALRCGAVLAGQEPCRPWLLGTGGLVGNHWFSPRGFG